MVTKLFFPAVYFLAFRRLTGDCREVQRAHVGNLVFTVGHTGVEGTALSCRRETAKMADLAQSSL
ncbi:hypothetical protein J6590_092649 [Homalodisca vitripennis]|nr:hypothetical protein J6590_092649 [Homalodisca vitripennis]